MLLEYQTIMQLLLKTLVRLTRHQFLVRRIIQFLLLLSLFFLVPKESQAPRESVDSRYRHMLMLMLVQLRLVLHVLDQKESNYPYTEEEFLQNFQECGRVKNRPDTFDRIGC